MGCVSSKHLKKQASVDGWISSPARTTTPIAQTLTANYSMECYHRHFVSLTSSSYGLLKVESPKPPELRHPHERGGVGSLSEMYGKLRSLEMADSNHSKLYETPFCEVNSMPDALNPYSKASLPAFTSRIDSPESVLSETINVRDMMMGLEEAASSQSSSPAERTLKPNTKILAPRQCTRIVEKKTAAFYGVGVIGAFRNPSSASHDVTNDDEDGSGKENDLPLYNQQHTKNLLLKSIGKTNDSPNRQPKSATFTRSALGNTSVSQVSRLPSNTTISARKGSSPLSQISQSLVSSKSSPSRMPSFQVSQPTRRESIVTRKRESEKGSPCRDTEIESSPTSSSSSAAVQSIRYAPSNGKVKLSLHTQHQNNCTFLHTPSSHPSRSMSRRLVVGGSLASTEPRSPLFDPDLVASYEMALNSASEGNWNACHDATLNGNHCGEDAREARCCLRKSMPTKELDKRLYDPLACFKKKCPPGGQKSVVLYTTTLRGIRKTFEDCNTLREILQSFGVSIDERDVSMHLEFLNELRELMDRVVSVPRMFIKGRYIGGIEEVVKLHEDGKLSELVEGLPKEVNGGNCDGCGGVRFVPCLECSGSCKVRSQEDNRVMRCPDCNENGLIQCPICT